VEILILFAAIVFCAVGIVIGSTLKLAAGEAIRLGDALVEESKRVQAEFDLAVREVLQKPQSNVIERVTYRMEVKGR